MNKKIIIGIVIAILIIAGIVIYIPKKPNIIKDIVDLNSVFEIENIKELKYKQNKEQVVSIADKYNTDGDCYVIEANVEFMDKTGKMLYIRNQINNLNIYQTHYEINIYEDVGIQIEEIINTFEGLCKRYLETEDKPIEKMRNVNQNKYKIPIGEEIYNENGQLTKTYNIGNDIYDINFYMKDKMLICEFVKILRD